MPHRVPLAPLAAAALALAACPSRPSAPDGSGAARASPPRPALPRPSPPRPAPRPPDACTGVANDVGVRLLPGFCMRAVATDLLRPRQMAVAPDGAVLVAESGRGWAHDTGRLSVLRPRPDGAWSRETVLDRLDRPHGVAVRGGFVYVAEAGRIARVPYPPRAGAAPEVVVGDLPARGRHVHKTLAFGPDGALYYSVGSGTDNCQDDGAAPDPCPDREGDPPRGVVRRRDLARGRDAVWARGLRNNLGLAWHPGSGRAFGVENSRDYIHRADAALDDATLPHDELNELAAGSDHGWPYCYDDALAAPEFPARAAWCRARTRRPAIDLPAHTAPISILFYEGALFPAAFRGRAFVTYHGYRAAGHRVVTIPFGADGAPSGPPEDFIAGWEERPGRPHGHLLGLAVTPDGALLVSDDVGRTIFRVAWGPSALHRPPPPPLVAPPAEDPAAVERRCRDLARQTAPFAAVQHVLDAKCVACHAMAAGGLTLRRCDWRASYEALALGRSEVHGAFVVPGHADRGYLMARLRGDTMGPRMPPPGVTLTPEELAAIERWVRAGAAPP